MAPNSLTPTLQENSNLPFLWRSGKKCGKVRGFEQEYFIKFLKILEIIHLGSVFLIFFKNPYKKWSVFVIDNQTADYKLSNGMHNFFLG